jgi:methyl-accepting chemotaxis protein
VRALAQRSAEAAKEIKGLISASAAQVAQGVDLVGATGKALARIVEHVAEIDKVVSGIAGSAQEQSTALHQVNAALNQMDQVTQQNAAMVEETTAAAHMLNQESDELARLVGRFQTGRPEAEDGRVERQASGPPPAPRALVKSAPCNHAPCNRAAAVVSSTIAAFCWVT